VSEQTALETNFGLDHAKPYQKFAAHIVKVKGSLQDHLRQLKSKGRTAAGYGASVGVTTLLYQFDLGGLLDFLVDDNPARYHLFSPGHHFPVLPSQALYDRKAAEVLVLAWAYFDPIRKKHQEFKKAGGRFIIPLPELRIF
jgi:hypothetical protein